MKDETRSKSLVSKPEFPFGNLSHLVLPEKSLLCFHSRFTMEAIFWVTLAMRIPERMGVERLIKALRFMSSNSELDHFQDPCWVVLMLFDLLKGFCFAFPHGTLFSDQQSSSAGECSVYFF